MDKKQPTENQPESSKPSSSDPKTSLKADKNAIEGLLEKLSAKMLLEEEQQQKEEMLKKEHKFWDTQPVPSVKPTSKAKKFDAPFIPDIPVDKIPKEQTPIPPEYKWCNIDISNPSEMHELYNLLSNHYVEDADEMFRFRYSTDFLNWALNPPNQNPDWHIGLRKTDGSNVLVAFISGLELQLKINSVSKRMAEINFLCINKSLRKLRLAPVLIREITRRFNLSKIYQAIYTAGIQIPTPISVCRYFHRPLNPKKLINSGFSRLPHDMTLAKLVMKYRLSPEHTPQIRGLRLMTEKDVPQVRKILNKYLNARTKVHQVFDTDAITKHWLLPRKDVIFTYVVEDVTKPGKITDFFSYYLLPSTVLKKKDPSNAKSGKSDYSILHSAYLFYYGLNTEPASGVEIEDSSISYKELNEKLLKERLIALMKNCLLIAKNENFDVFNCVLIQDNATFLEDLKFGQGDGSLNYYFYNWNVRPFKNNEIGLTML
ncbi:hypothetical protein BB560_000061 [Smittium megazygosporum]|uniref:Glycylpeptide N-tetradecanoyltransferase n=1 Tax=Smittium megazygosporum TaxID=133381 RepID=A0A2T9ZLG1_9FUNG|nr:hypothetical protein BB560_000061 [Smittium megazygosporum]